MIEQHTGMGSPDKKMGRSQGRKVACSHQHYHSTSGQHGGDRGVEVHEKSTSNEYALGVAFWSFVLFTATQVVFSAIANSQAMMADSQAMFVDALTYLFNLIAERLKRKSYTEEEMNSIHPKVLAYRRERLRLYLELFPPLISASILIWITFHSTQNAIKSLSQPRHNDKVNIDLMLIFSFGNLLLDFLNVGCFANAHQAYGISEVEKEEILYTTHRDEEEASEETALMQYNGVPDDGVYDLCDIEEEQSTIVPKPKLTLNLNMCSAYTVSQSRFLNRCKTR